VCVSICLCLYLRLCVCARVCVCLYLSICLCLYLRVCVCSCTCMCVRVCVHAYGGPAVWARTNGNWSCCGSNAPTRTFAVRYNASITYMHTHWLSGLDRPEGEGDGDGGPAASGLNEVRRRHARMCCVGCGPTRRGGRDPRRRARRPRRLPCRPCRPRTHLHRRFHML
jgi:hypothetical protein